MVATLNSDPVDSDKLVKIQKIRCMENKQQQLNRDPNLKR